MIERVAVGSIKQRSLASSSCLECSQSYGDCVCEETSFQIAVAWLHKWSKSDGEALQWAAHKMTFIWGVCVRVCVVVVVVGWVAVDGLAVWKVCWSFQMHGRNQISPRNCSARCCLRCSQLELQTAKCRYAKGEMVSHAAHCVPTEVFLEQLALIEKTKQNAAQPCSSRPTSQANPPAPPRGPRVPTTFFFFLMWDCT